jgi:putative oxidoreductase
MKIVKQIPAYLLGAMFIFGGASYLFKFAPEQPLTGNAAIFMDLFAKNTGYMTTIKVCELLFGILVLIPKTRALGLILLAPIVVNILLFEVHLDKGPAIGAGLTVITALAIYLNKEKYASILS